MITVYSLEGCGICDFVKTWLGNNGHEYVVVSNRDEVVRVGEEVGLSNLPIVEMNGEWFSGREIIDELKGE